MVRGFPGVHSPRRRVEGLRMVRPRGEQDLPRQPGDRLPDLRHVLVVLSAIDGHSDTVLEDIPNREKADQETAG